MTLLQRKCFNISVTLIVELTYVDRCVQCFYTNKWLYDPGFAEDAQRSIRRFCNSTRPNVTRFDEIPMVELVAGIAPPSRGGRIGPKIWSWPIPLAGSTSLEASPVVTVMVTTVIVTKSASLSTSPPGGSETSTTTTASSTAVAPTPSTVQSGQSAARSIAMPGAWILSFCCLAWQIVPLNLPQA